jgi:MFS family permease
LNFIPQSDIYFHLSWLTFGLFTGLFWPAYHSEIALTGSKTHRGSQMGTMQILATLFGTLSPIVGGYFLEFTNFMYLLIFATIILTIGIIPLIFSKDIKLKNYSFPYKKYLQFIKSKKHKNSKKAFAYNGIYSILVLYIWPIILFILLSENFFKYGTLMTAVSLFSTLIILYIKAFFDKKDKNKFLKQINILLSLNWFIKSIIFLFGIIFLYIIESIYKLLINIFNMAYLSIFYNNAKKNSFMDYIILRELYLHITRISFSIILILILITMGENIITLSAILFAGVFMSLGFNCFREEIA